MRWWRWAWHLAGEADENFVNPDALTPEAVWRIWSAWRIAHGEGKPDFAECAPVDPTAVKHRLHQEVPAAVRASLPDWLDSLGLQSLGAAWPATRAALNEPARVFLRVNTLRANRAAVQERLATDGIDTQPIATQPDALVLTGRKNLATHQAFRDGWFEVQDLGSQRLAPLLETHPGQIVIDACAGAGGKALHLSALMNNRGHVHALDPHPSRLAELDRRAVRAGATIISTRQIADPATVAHFAKSADRVLLDVPCSGLGVLRRHPDTKWKLTPAELERLEAVQAGILTTYSSMVKPGGKLLYATCSLLPQENTRQVQRFLAVHGTGWTLEHEETIALDAAGADAYFAARLRRH